MELELKTNHISCYDTVLDTTLFQEETLESIVPDACPDILRIVDTEAMVCLQTKDAVEGRAEAGGTVRCAILYQPDGGEGIRRITVSLPFSTMAEGAGITSACRVVAVPRVQSADARSLNPRKILTRVSLAVDLQVFAPDCLSLCQGVECPPEGGIQQLCDQQSSYTICAVEEKPFTFSDDLNLSGSKPAAEELLKVRTDLVCGESKIIGRKLIFKGEATLQLLYRAAGGQVCPASFELPFSQIMEVSEVEEEADCALDVLLTSCDCSLDGGEGRTLSVSLTMLAQAVVREERRFPLLSDAYSTLFTLETVRESHTFYHMVERSERRITVRELVETPTPVQEVCDVYVTVGAVEQKREEGQVSFGAETRVTILYRGEDGALCTVVQPLAAVCPVELPEGCLCTCRCACPGERFATPAGGGVEVRYPIDFRYLALTPVQSSAIADLHLDEAAPRDHAGQPSIVLRMVSQGEQLWDIAKAYGTTMEDIIQANALPEESLPMGQLLLIPKKR